MSEEEILEKLLDFSESLTMGTFVLDFLRTVVWWLVLGMAWIIDALENIADTILGLRIFLDNPEIQEFITQMQPLLVILFAFNILFIGYLLIFQKEFNRAGVFSNVFMALVIVVALGSAMEQGNEFTGDTIDAINVDDEYNNETIANQVIQDNITDVGVFDQEGWSTPDLDNRNQIETPFARDIDINSYLTEGSAVTAEEELSPEGEDILSHKVVTFADGSRAVEELEDGNWITDISQQYYYRYTIDWINLIGTLSVMAVVLITVSVKLASLFFELTFNYILAPFVAASDMHSGQRMKQVTQNILNILLVTIMIFLSLKIYLIGTGFLGEQLDGFPYLIAMIGLAVAVMNGPNIIERMFGIDAGGKGGMAALAGAYAIGKGATGLASKGTKSAASMANGAMDKNDGAKDNNKIANQNVSDAANKKGGNTENGQGQMGEGSKGLENNENVANKAQNQEKGQSQSQQNLAAKDAAAMKGSKGNQMDNVAAASGTAAGGAATSGQSANAKGAGKTTPSNNKQNNGQSTDDSPSQGMSPTSIHEEMDKDGGHALEEESGNYRPTSLHDEMKQKETQGTKQGKKNASGATASGSIAGGTAASRASQTTSSNESINDGGTNAVPEESIDQQVSQNEQPGEAASVSEQKQVGGSNNQTSSGNPAAAGGTTASGAAASGSGGKTKTSTKQNTQQMTGQNGNVGKEMVEEQTDTVGDSSSNNVEQETLPVAGSQRSNEGQQTSVSQTTSGGGSSNNEAPTNQPVSPLTGSSGGSPSVSSATGSTNNGETKTSTVKNTQRQGGSSNGSTNKEIVEEQNEVIHENGGSNTVEQERRATTSTRQESRGNTTNVQQSVSGGGSSSSTGDSSNTSPSSAGSSGSSGGSSTGSSSSVSSSGGGQTISREKTTFRVSDGSADAAPERHVIEEENEIIHEGGLGRTSRQQVSRNQRTTSKEEGVNKMYSSTIGKRKEIRRNFKKNIPRNK